jgi:hypothetical protein
MIHLLFGILDLIIHRNSLITSIVGNLLEAEIASAILFLDVMVIKIGCTVDTEVYRKPTHTGHYLHFQLNHLPHVKRGVIQSLYHRSTTICKSPKIALMKLMF